MVARLTKQLLAHFEDRDPDNVHTKAALDGTMARIRHASEALANAPLPAWAEARRAAAVSDEEADAIVAGVLARMRERR